MSEVVTARGQGIHSTWHIPQPCWKNSMVQIVLNVFLELCGKKKKYLKPIYAWEKVKSHSASLGIKGSEGVHENLSRLVSSPSLAGCRPCILWSATQQVV